MAIWDFFVNYVFGSPAFFTIFLIGTILITLLLIRSPRETIIVVSGLFLIGVITSGLIPKWILIIVAILMGLLVGTLIIRFFFRHY